MPTAVNVTRLFSLALDGALVGGANSSLGFVMQPVGGPLMLPDNTSEWVELASNSSIIDGGMHPVYVNHDVLGAMFRLRPYFSAGAVGLTQGPEGFKFPAGTTMQFGVIAPPGTDLVVPNPGGTNHSPYCWWNSDGYWALDTLYWSFPDNPDDTRNIRMFIVVTTSVLAPPPQPSEFWTNFIGSHEII